MQIFFIAILFSCLALSIDEVSAGQWRVVNGLEAMLGQFPFIASIEGCTASILNRDTVLTAGHCVCKQAPESVKVGVLNKYSRILGQNRAVRETIIHPGYSGSCGKVHPMDIAILKLAEPLEFNDNVQPIELFCEQPERGREIISMGYGLDEDENAGILKYGYNTVAYGCKKFICSTTRPNHINYGDSGGPMVVIGDDGVYKQAGVNSGIGMWSLYSQIPKACDWIKERM